MENKVIMTTYSRQELKELVGEVLQENSITNENKIDASEKLDQNSAAKFLNVSTQTLINWKKKHLIPYYQIGKSVFYLKHELLEALKNNPILNK